MISENVRNLSVLYFLIGKLELRQYLPTKIIVNVELNEKKQAQFLAQPVPHVIDNGSLQLLTVTLKLLIFCMCSCYTTGTQGIHRGFPSQGTPV